MRTGNSDHLGLHNSGNVVVKPSGNRKEYIIIGNVSSYFLTDLSEKYLISDGQQRLTTTMLVLAAVRDELKSRGETTGDRYFSRIFLRSGNQETRLLPSLLDRPAFEGIMTAAHLAPEAKESIQFKAYIHFKVTTKQIYPNIKKSRAFRRNKLLN